MTRTKEIILGLVLLVITFLIPIAILEFGIGTGFTTFVILFLAAVIELTLPAIACELIFR